MKIFAFILVPILVVTAYALYQWFRNRQPSSVESGIDAFRREMSALSPERAPVNRRPEWPRPTDPAPSGTVSISDPAGVAAAPAVEPDPEPEPVAPPRAEPAPERRPAPDAGRSGPRRPGAPDQGAR
ncbi:MAG: hypothetical protein U0P45_16180 [Acidimicrobiales bacterium]